MSFFKTYFLHFICNIFAFCAQHYTGDDKKNVINLYSMFANKKRQQKAITTVKDIKKYATDVLGNLYEVKDNKLKLEFK